VSDDLPKCPGHACDHVLCIEQRRVLDELAAERQAREKAEQERDRLREALTDVLRHCPTLDTLNAVDDDAGSGKRPCPLPKTPRIADIRDWHAALSPQDGQPT
jgi:hypothetical protein